MSSSEPTKKPPSISSILNLSDEMLLTIFGYLGPRTGTGVLTLTDDLINLSRSCTKFDNLLQDSSICRRLNVPWNIYADRSNLVKFLTQGVRAELISELNLNDLYWIPSNLIRDIGIRLKNLKDLHVAGTSLSFKHLQEVFLAKNKVTDIEKLSMSWHTERSQYYPMCDSKEFQQKLMHLRALSIFILPTFIGNSYKDPSYEICQFLVHCGIELEKLWIYSYGNAFPEVMSQQVHIHAAKELDGSMEKLYFPKLVDFMYRMNNPQKSNMPKLVSKIMFGFAKNGDQFPKKPKQLWIDHPDLRRYCTIAYAGNPAGWPQMDLSNLESLSLPLYDEVLNTLFDKSFKQDLSKCKHIQISSEVLINSVPNVNQLFQSVGSSLKSFVSKSDCDENYKVDWDLFAITHPNLTLVNLFEEEALGITYPYWCIGLTQLAKLQRISIPIHALEEIKDGDSIRKFRILAASKGVCVEEEPTLKKPNNYESQLFNKGRRVPHSSSKASSSGGSAKTQIHVSGLDFLTHGCPEIEEFEMGFDNIYGEGTADLYADPDGLVLNSLVSIRLWKNLRKLTLVQIVIGNGNFLIDIGQSCPLLESIRLFKLGTRAKCNYTLGLCKALNYCQQLKDFRLQQNYVGNPTRIIQALQSCTKLERLAIFSWKNDQPLESKPIENLMKVCPKLSVLYLIIGSTTKLLCDSLRKNLHIKYKSTRPPLSILIHNHKYNNMTDNEFRIRFDFPPKHYREMVVFSTQVEPNYDYPDKFV